MTKKNEQLVGHPLQFIDYDLLHEQKKSLLKKIWNNEHDPCWGIVELLDDIQDWAEENGLWEHKPENIE